MKQNNKIDSKNLSLYYIVPSLSFKYKSIDNKTKLVIFNKNNYELINSYIDKTSNTIHIRMKIFNIELALSKNYLYQSQENTKLFMVFSLPKKYIKEYFHFFNSEYTKFSFQYKKLLINYSGLPFYERGSSHKLLLGLFNEKKINGYVPNRLYNYYCNNNKVDKVPEEYQFIKPLTEKEFIN
jgi:hypothetical protein